MTLGCEDLGDRIANSPLLGGVAAGSNRGADHGRVDAESLGQLGDGGAVGPRSAPIAQEAHGAGRHAGTLGEAFPALLGGQQAFQEGCEGVASFGHGSEGSETFRSFPGSLLDFLPKFADACQRQEREPGVIRQDSPGLAGTETVRNQPVTTLPTPALFANLEDLAAPLSPRQIELDRTAKLGSWHDGPLVHFQGVASRWSPRGQFLHAAAHDVDEYLAHYGEPVTHERAVEIASQQGGWTPGWYAAWDKAVAEYAQDCLDAQGDVS